MISGPTALDPDTPLEQTAPAAATTGYPRAVADSFAAGGLPDFDDPPVIEVALSVQFSPLPLRAMDLYPLWESRRDDYPRRDEQPPLPPITAGGGPQAFVRFGTPPGARQWWLSDDGAFLLQLQHDRFALNWRRVPQAADYPRFPVLLDRFTRELKAFEDFVGDRGSLEISAAEVLYVNDLDHKASGAELTEPASTRLECLASVPSHHLGEPTETWFNLLYRVPDDPTTTLRVTLEPATRHDGQAIAQLLLTATSWFGSTDATAAIRWLSVGRSHIVRSFRELTTEPIHDRWGLNR